MVALTQITPSIVDAAAALRDSATEMEAAAWREGVDPSGVLGPFVSALKHALIRLAELSERSETGIAANIAAGRRLTELELQKTQHMLQAAAAALQQARSAQVQLEIQRDTVVARLVERIGPELSDEIKQWRVIKEREHNRRAARRRAAATTVIALGLVLAAYLGRAWEDRDATAALARCTANLLVDPNTHRVFCDMSDFTAR